MNLHASITVRIIIAALLQYVDMQLVFFFFLLVFKFLPIFRTVSEFLLL